MRFAVGYFWTMLSFIAIDLVWLGLIAKQFYRDEMGSLMAQPFYMPAAVAFYLLYPAGVVFFAVLPASIAGSWIQALVWGGLLGLFAYGTYDLTSLATVKGWSARLAIADLLWGGFLTALSATAGYWGMR